MARRNPNFTNWDGPSYRAGRDVMCTACAARGGPLGVCEEGEQIDVDRFIDCLCDHCGGTGIEPWRPAGGRDTSAPCFDALGNGQLRHWRDGLARDKRAGKSDHHLAWVRRAHRSAVERFIGRPVLIELSVAETFGPLVARVNEQTRRIAAVDAKAFGVAA